MAGEKVVVELVVDARAANAALNAYAAANEKASAAISKTVAVNDNAAAAIERSTVSMTQSTSRQAAAWDRLASRADAVTAARLQLEKAQRTGSAMMAIDASRADEVNAVLGVYSARLDAATAAAARGTAANALNSGQVQNLTFQLNDMATMLASGQSPFVMLMQQGMQMAQVFGPGVGVGGALKATGAALLSFITNPLTLAVAGLAAAAGAVSLLWDAVTGGGPSAEETLQRQRDLIDAMKDAYDETNSAAVRLAKTQGQMFFTSAMQEQVALAEELKRVTEDTLAESMGGAARLQRLFASPAPGLVEDWERFREALRTGQADATAFRDHLDEVARAFPTAENRAFIQTLMEATQPLFAVEERTRLLNAQLAVMQGTATAAQRALLGLAEVYGVMGSSVDRGMALRFTDAFGDLDTLKDELDGFVKAEADAAKKADQMAKALDGVTDVPLPNLRPEVDNIVKGLENAEGAAKSFATALVGGSTSGGSVLDALGTAISGLTQTLGQSLGNSVSGLIGGSTSGIFGSILSGLGGGLVSSLVSGIGGIIDSIFGGNDEEERAARQLRRQERRDRIEARKERLEEKEEKRLARQEARARRMEGYADRAFTAGLDTGTLDGRLAQFDLEAQREREAVIRAGGKKVNQELAALDAALAAERLQIQRDFNDEMIADAKAAADEMNRVGRSIVDYVNGLNTGSDSPLSPQDRFTAAQAAFGSQLALAQGGNVDAQSSITQYADAYLKAAREMYASSQDFQDIFATVKAALLALPAVQQSDDPVVQALLTAQNAIVSAVDLMRTTLNAAINSGPAATATALGPLFDTIDVNASGGITLAEMQTALGTTNDRLQAVFNEIDVNGSGTISRLELLAKDTSLSTLAKDATVSKDQSLVAGLTSLTRAIVGTNAQGADNIVKAGIANQLGLSYHIEAMTQSIYAMSQITQYGWNSLAKAVKQLNKTIAKNGAVRGGMIGYETGGTVANGVYNVDSVSARYAGGGEIMLAGGEFVTRAPSVNAMTAPVLDAINRTGRVSGMGANDNGRYFADQNRVLMAGFRAMVETLQAEVSALRAEVRRSGGDVARAVKDKPVAKPATKTA